MRMVCGKVLPFVSTDTYGIQWVKSGLCNLVHMSFIDLEGNLVLDGEGGACLFKRRAQSQEFRKRLHSCLMLGRAVVMGYKHKLP